MNSAVVSMYTVVNSLSPCSWAQPAAFALGDPSSPPPGNPSLLWPLGHHMPWCSSALADGSSRPPPLILLPQTLFFF